MSPAPSRREAWYIPGSGAPKVNLLTCREPPPRTFQDKGYRAGIAIAVLAGSLPNRQETIARAWELIDSDELAAVWELTGTEGETFKIDSLR